LWRALGKIFHVFLIPPAGAPAGFFLARGVGCARFPGTGEGPSVLGFCQAGFSTQGGSLVAVSARALDGMRLAMYRSRDERWTTTAKTYGFTYLITSGVNNTVSVKRRQCYTTHEPRSGAKQHDRSHEIPRKARQKTRDRRRQAAQTQDKVQRAYSKASSQT